MTHPSRFLPGWRLVVTCLAACLLLSCASHPAARRALVVGLGALGTGAAVAAQACAAQGTDACRETGITAAVAVLGTALASGATAYLDSPATQGVAP